MGNKTLSLWDGIIWFTSTIGLVFVGSEFNTWWSKLYHANHITLAPSVIISVGSIVFLVAAFLTIGNAFSEG